MGKTHRWVGGTTAFAASTSAAVATSFPLELVLACTAVATIASTLPDDLEVLPSLRRGRPGARIFPHRTVTHWPALQLVVLGGLAYVVVSLSTLPGLYVAAVLGAVALACVMHSVADAMTIDPRGVALLWPLFFRGFHVLPRFLRVAVATDSRSEMVFRVAWGLFSLALFYAAVGVVFAP